MSPDRARQLLDAEHERLEALRDAERQRFSDTLDSQAGELTTFSQHPADVATETHERERDLSLIQTMEQGLEEVADARRRLSEGTYGQCEMCGEAIPDERLEAQPTARYCVRHQAEVESEGETGSA